jgi:GNAT superfamily N-acetyltransferase
MPPVIRRCAAGDWRDVRRLHIKLALGLPLVVDVELNEVLAIPDDTWREFVRACADGPEQAVLIAMAGQECVGMGHVRLNGTQARLDMLYVDATARRQGIGAGLVSAQSDWASSLGAKKLAAHIPEASAAGELAEHLRWRRADEVSFTKHGLRERKWTASV